jgi:hypothetical protein
MLSKHGEDDRIDPLLLCGEFTLNPDGIVTGSAVLVGGGSTIALAVTGSHDEPDVPDSPPRLRDSNARTA